MRYIIIILISVIISCGQRDNKTTFLGNWYSCDKDGHYFETHVKESYFYYVEERFPEGAIYQYEIKADTLFFEIRRFTSETTRKFYLIEIVDHDHIRLKQNKETGERITELFRINDNVLSYPDIKSGTDNEKAEILKKDFNTRNSKNSCVDRRTKEEITKDSTDRSNIINKINEDTIIIEDIKKIEK